MNENKININWYPGHMFKTKKELQEQINKVDVVIELLDARIPISSRNPDIKELTKGKKKIILLNKSDYAEENETKKWVNFFKKEAEVVVSNALMGKGIKEVLEKVDYLLIDKKKKDIEKGIKNPKVKVLIIGIPNVGKSTFINKLTKKNTQAVGNKPGVTKKTMWINGENNLSILDTPGILWPRFENAKTGVMLSACSCIKDEVVDLVEVGYNLVIHFFEIGKLDEVLLKYKFSEEEIDVFKKELEVNKNKFKIVNNIINKIAEKRGYLLKGGVFDYEKTAKMLLLDFRKGNFGKITLEKVDMLS